KSHLMDRGSKFLWLNGKIHELSRLLQSKYQPLLSIFLKLGKIGLGLFAFSWRRIMASYAGHLSLSAVLGAAYGSAGAYYYHMDWGRAILAAGLTTIGGVLPDLDRD